MVGGGEGAVVAERAPTIWPLTDRHCSVGPAHAPATARPLPHATQPSSPVRLDVADHLLAAVMASIGRAVQEGRLSPRRCWHDLRVVAAPARSASCPGTPPPPEQAELPLSRPRTALQRAVALGSLAPMFGEDSPYVESVLGGGAELLAEASRPSHPDDPPLQRGRGDVRLLWLGLPMSGPKWSPKGHMCNCNYAAVRRFKSSVRGGGGAGWGR